MACKMLKLGAEPSGATSTNPPDCEIIGVMYRVIIFAYTDQI